MWSTGPGLGRYRSHDRRQIADGLEAAARRARRPARAVLGARAVTQGEAGGAAYEPLLALAARLRREAPAPRREGVALARRLATDSTAELWSWHGSGALRDAVATALRACDEGGDGSLDHFPA